MSASSTPAEPLAELSPDQQQRVCQILDNCFESLEAGKPVDRNAILDEHPDLAQVLPEYLDGLQFLQNAAAGFHPAPDAADGSPKQVGDFRIIRELGRGGMGIVYEAEQLSLGRTVALKVLPFASLLSSRQIARFRNEAQAAAKIEHPGIVPVFAIGIDRGLHYFAMQRIHGSPLDQVIQTLMDLGSAATTPAQAVAASPDPAHAAAPRDASVAACHELAELRQQDMRQYCRRVAALGADAARAIQAAHDESIVHRDIKPSNLLLDPRGKVWVADFGLARCKDSQDLTGAHDVLGTLKYMSPEQANGSEWVDHRTDIYSLGVTLYELLTLHAAVAGETPAAIAHALERRTPHRLRTWDPRIPHEWERVIRKAIAREPSDRYSTAAAFADDLACLAAGRPVSRERWAKRLGRWTRRCHHGIAAALAVSTTIAAVLCVFTALLLSQRTRADRALAAAHRSAQAHQVQLARADHQAGVLYIQTGKHDTGLRLIHQSVSRLREVMNDPRETATGEANSQLVAALHGLAVADTSASPEDRLRWLREAARRHQEGVRGPAGAPSGLDVDWEVKMGLLQTAIGDVETEQGQWRRASEAYDDALTRWQTVVQHLPRSFDAAKSLAAAWQRAATAHQSAGSVGPSAYDAIRSKAHAWLQSSPWSLELKSEPQIGRWAASWAPPVPNSSNHVPPGRSSRD